MLGSIISITFGVARFLIPIAFISSSMRRQMPPS
jgi:hypothetical protein